MLLWSSCLVFLGFTFYFFTRTMEVTGFLGNFILRVNIRNTTFRGQRRLTFIFSGYRTRHPDGYRICMMFVTLSFTMCFWGTIGMFIIGMVVRRHRGHGSHKVFAPTSGQTGGVGVFTLTLTSRFRYNNTNITYTPVIGRKGRFFGIPFILHYTTLLRYHTGTRDLSFLMVFTSILYIYRGNFLHSFTRHQRTRTSCFTLIGVQRRFFIGVPMFWVPTFRGLFSWVRFIA